MRWLLQESIILRLLFIIGQRENKKQASRRWERESGVAGIALVVLVCKIVLFFLLLTYPFRRCASGLFTCLYRITYYTGT
jgi:hypothetical protein